MSEYVVKGCKPLFGVLRAQGSKNSAVAVLMACIAVKGRVIIKRVPYMTDVLDCISILLSMGAEVSWLDEDVLSVDCRYVEDREPPREITAKMRASTYLMGARLARFGRCSIPIAGGCDFGSRPIDIHLKVFEDMGAVCDGRIISFPKGRVSVGEVSFSRVTVGGTVNALIASALGSGKIVFHGCAIEPHVCDLARFLNACGAQIIGVGGGRTEVVGVAELHGCEFELSGDMIEAGTYLIMGAATRGRVRMEGVKAEELSSLSDLLERMGCGVRNGVGFVQVEALGDLNCAFVETGVYPGFPTDLHPQIAALMGTVRGSSGVTEAVYGASRFGYLDELRRFGVRFSVEGASVKIWGGRMTASDVKAPDLRGGAALLTAALCADGESRIRNGHFLERGYSGLSERLRILEADIERG